MYQSTFGFQQRPFSATVRPDWYFETEALKQVYQSMAGCIERAAGPAMLVGAPGTGKTMLCQVLAQKMRSTFNVVVLDSARLCTRRAFLQSVLFELGLPYRDLEEGELRLTLIDYLNPSDECPNGMLLVVDEAHVLPMRLMEELHMITNLVRDGQPRVRLALAGNRSLEERFTHPQLESFNQRVAIRCYLKSLNAVETATYIAYQLMKAGGPDATTIISGDACQAVYDMSEGLPRLINQVCDHALVLAAANGVKEISPRMIAEAWADIQQLPTPWFASSEEANSDSPTIEFGELDADELDADEPAIETSASPTVMADDDDPFADAPTAEFGSDSTVSKQPVETSEVESISTNDPIESLETISDAVDSAAASLDKQTRAAIEQPATAEHPAAQESPAAEEDPIVEKTVRFENSVEALAVDENQQNVAIRMTERGPESAPEPSSDLEPEFGFDNPANPFAEEFEEEVRVTDSDDGEDKEVVDAIKPAIQPAIKPAIAPQRAPTSVPPMTVRVQRQPAVDVSVDQKTKCSTIKINPTTASVVVQRSECDSISESGTTECYVTGSASVESSCEDASPARIKLTQPAKSDDDRDIIVMNFLPELNTAHEGSAEPSSQQKGEEASDDELSPKAHREEYQSLFDRLRNG